MQSCRRQADEIQQTGDLFDQALESMSDALFLTNRSGVLIRVNRSAGALLERDAAELIGKPFSEVCDATKIPASPWQLLERAPSGTLPNLEVEIRTRTGGAVSASASCGLVRDKRRRITGVLIIVRDITERKRADAALLENEAKLRACLEFASQGIVVINSAGGIELVNAKTEEMFGYPRDELLGQTLEMLVPERARPFHLRKRADYFAGPHVRPMGIGLELAGRRKDGSEFPVEISLSFIQTKGGLLAISFLSDITERKRLEEHLRQTQKLESIGVLAAGIAHDFNNLLTGILGNASLAEEMLSPADPAGECVQNVMRASERAADLIRQLLAYAGKGSLIVEPVDISGLVRDIANLIQASIPKTVQLRLVLAENLPPVEGDPTQIQQLVMNLVLNAAEAIGESRGSVLITAGVQEVGQDRVCSTVGAGEIKAGQYVWLEIQDSGCGMDEETKARIFDPFFTTKFAGRGLGLAAVLGIVRGHKGALEVDSSPGLGSSFKILLPAMAASAAASEEAILQKQTASGSGR